MAINREQELASCSRHSKGDAPVGPVSSNPGRVESGTEGRWRRKLAVVGVVGPYLKERVVGSHKVGLARLEKRELAQLVRLMRLMRLAAGSFHLLVGISCRGRGRHR